MFLETEQLLYFLKMAVFTIYENDCYNGQAANFIRDNDIKVFKFVKEITYNNTQS